MNSVAENTQVQTSSRSLSPADHSLQPEHWLERYGDVLYRYAWVRLRDKSDAEDLVQQTFLEAFESRARYKRQVSEKNWLFTILKHNLIDLLRRREIRPARSADEPNDADALPDPFEHSGRARGKWRPEFEPVDLRSPAHDLLDAEFWRIFHRCVSKLPPRIARMVLLRELDALPTEEICSVIGISQTNFWVMRHRARIALQQCLKREWFQ